MKTVSVIYITSHFGKEMEQTDSFYLHTVYPYLENNSPHKTFSKWEVLNKMKNKCV